MHTFIGLPFDQVIRIMELCVYVDHQRAGTEVSARRFAALYEGISRRQVSRDLFLAVELGLPLRKVENGYRKISDARFAVLPLLRASEKEIHALESVAALAVDCSVATELSRLAGILREILALAPQDPPPAASMELPHTARLALLDELLSSSDACSRREIADRLCGGQTRMVSRHFFHLSRLGAEVLYDDEEGGYYHARPFYFGVAILRPASFHCLDRAIETAGHPVHLSALQSIRASLLDGLETADTNYCFESFTYESVTLRDALDRFSAGQRLPLRVLQMPAAARYEMAA